MLRMLRSGAIKALVLDSPWVQWTAAANCDLFIVGDMVLPVNLVRGGREGGTGLSSTRPTRDAGAAQSGKHHRGPRRPSAAMGALRRPRTFPRGAPGGGGLAAAPLCSCLTCSQPLRCRPRASNARRACGHLQAFAFPNEVPEAYLTLFDSALTVLDDAGVLAQLERQLLKPADPCHS